jgi:hypothetical protein
MKTLENHPHKIPKSRFDFAASAVSVAQAPIAPEPNTGFMRVTIDLGDEHFERSCSVRAPA